MKKITQLVALLAFLIFFVNPVFAAPVTLVDQGSVWQYDQFSTPDLWVDWSAANYGSFDWDSATWSTGNAAFGNRSSYNTYWAANTDLALAQTFSIDDALTSSLTLNVAADNGFMVFINGAQIAKENAEGFTSYWEYTLSIPNSYFSMGDNLIQVLAEDHGGATFFDLKLSGETAPVPEPATFILLGSGLAGLAFYRRKRK